MRARTVAFALISASFLSVTFGFTSMSSVQTSESPVASLVKLGFKFDGAKTCSAAACHGGNEPGEPPHGLDTYTKWNGKDPHRAAFDALSKDDSKKIASGMGIADAATSEKCLSCHATNVPENLRGKDFAVEDGNSCSTCHGPSEKWREAHSTKGWTEDQRKAAGAPAFGYEPKLLAAVGIYDTKSLVYRAERCASCHLAIDAGLVAKGHPVPVFELDYYSNPNVYQDRHWKDQKYPYFNAEQWASGQIVGVRDAMRQLASRASGGADDAAIKDAWEQAMSHAHALKALVAAGGPGADVWAKAEAVKPGDKAAIAAAATATAAAAEAQFSAVAAFKPTKETATKAAAALAADEELTKSVHGVEQQAYGIYALYNAVVVSEKIAEADANGVNDSIAKLFGPLDPKTKGKMDGYADALKEVAGKLPK